MQELARMYTPAEIEALVAALGVVTPAFRLLLRCLSAVGGSRRNHSPEPAVAPSR